MNLDPDTIFLMNMSLIALIICAWISGLFMENTRFETPVKAACALIILPALISNVGLSIYSMLKYSGVLP